MSTPEEGAVALAQKMFDLAREGRTAELTGYLDAGAPVNLTDAKGDTLLILAAYHQQPDAVAALLERGADVERLNDRGQNALVCAVFRQDGAIVRQLIAAGADPDGGRPSARATAEYFQLPDMSALMAPAPPGSPKKPGSPNKP
ncbi:ankyrin repeat domain-containing protein [Georgenia halophila]|uniref:ankyrin repeat domain-containing protein n=1 Tax=Georgenia halophila TaxID=620889 RepID=UPI0031EBF689